MQFCAQGEVRNCHPKRIPAIIARRIHWLSEMRRKNAIT